MSPLDATKCIVSCIIPNKKLRLLITSAALILMSANALRQISVVFKDRSKLYFSERPIMVAGENLIAPQARLLQPGRDISGDWFF